jgi:hypothetical protein
MAERARHLWAVTIDDDIVVARAPDEGWTQLVSAELGTLMSAVDLVALAVEHGRPVHFRHYVADWDEGIWWPDGSVTADARIPLDAGDGAGLLRTAGLPTTTPFRYRCKTCGLTLWGLDRIDGTVTHAVDGALCGPIEPDDPGAR